MCGRPNYSPIVGLTFQKARVVPNANTKGLGSKKSILHREQPDGEYRGQESEGSGDENEAGGSVIDEVLFFYAFECGVKHLLFIWSDSEIDGERLGVFLIFVDMVFEEGHGCNLNLK
jgi:hypothetical protein